MVASDRVSAYDHVLSTPIPDKGRILTAMTLWWFEQLDGRVSSDEGPLGTHLLGTDVPAPVVGRAMVCRRLEMVPVECVARGYLTGSGLSDYRSTGEVCGNPLPPGLVDGSRLPEPIFTPATKAALGEHDENVSLVQVAATVGDELAHRLRDLTLAIYALAEGISRDRGIVLADTKLELGHDPASGVLVLGDEVLTPDSSRFWPAEDYEPGRTQASFDKQVVRDWLTGPESGWDRAVRHPAAATAGRGRRAHPRAVPRGVPAADRADLLVRARLLVGARPMRSEVVQVRTGREQVVVDLTDECARFVADEQDGLLHVFVPHATAGVAVLETGAGSDDDLLTALEHLLPRDTAWRHRHGSPGHGRDHVLPALVPPYATIPVLGGRLALGTWQSICLVDTNVDNPDREVRLSFLAG